MNDPAVLRRRIAELELENKRLRETDSHSASAGTIGSKGFSTMRQGNPAGSGMSTGGNYGQDKDWMNFGGAALERPTTANVN